MIRPARPDELTRLQEIERAAGAAFRAVDMDVVADDPPLPLEILARYQRDGRAWVAVEGCDPEAAPVAYLLVELVDGAAHVEQVAVHPDLAGQRLGAALIDAATAWAEQERLPRITLTTFTGVPWNGPYYERLGFRYLADHELGLGLRRKREAEAAHGLDPWPRAAMARPVRMPDDLPSQARRCRTCATPAAMARCATSTVRTPSDSPASRRAQSSSSTERGSCLYPGRHHRVRVYAQAPAGQEPALASVAVLPRSIPRAELVLLRLVTHQDAVSLASLWEDERVREFLGGALGEEEARAKSLGYIGRAGAFAVALPRSDIVVGLVVVDRHATGDFEVSYMFRPSAWGHGYATAALRAVLAWSIDAAGLPRIIAVTQSANKRSLALLERVGLRREREFVEYGAHQTLLVLQPTNVH